MNRVILIGRLTKDPDIRWTQGQESMCIARYTLAVDRKGKDQKADFISCVAFGKGAEFAEKYLTKGTKIAVEGHIQTGSYKNRDGNTVYTTDVIVDAQEFAESKGNSQGNSNSTGNANVSSGYSGAPQEQYQQQTLGEGFMDIADDVDDAGLPFN